MLDAELLEQLRSVYDDLALPPDHEFVATCNDLPREQATAVQRQILSALGPALADALPGHRPFLAGFISKGAAGGPTTAFHQDLTYTDERVDRALLLWIPLVDLDGHSGALRVVPGSHLWVDGLRPAGQAALPTEDLQDELAARATQLSLRAGEAVLYDAALVHGAPASPAGRSRPAVAVALAPTGALLVHADAGPEGLACFQLDAGPLRTTRASWNDRSVRSRSSRGPVPSRRPTCGPHWRDARNPHPPPPRASAAATASVGSPTNRHRGRPVRRRGPGVLADGHRDHLLGRDGFVTQPLLDAGEVAELRSTYGVLHGWSGRDFEADLNNADTTYRRNVSDVLAAALDATVTGLFRRHEPFLRVYLCKWPGESSDLYIHRDWMYTDERLGHRTYVVWIALQDVVGDRGLLQVLRGSHRFDPMPRGTDLNAPWLRHQDLIHDRLEVIPVRAGEAVIFDNQLVHASLPNTSSEPRLVVAMGMKDRDAPLVHFRRDPDGRAVRYDVDPQFFLTETPAGLLGAPPDLAAVERFAPAELDLDGTALAHRLDRGLSARVRRLLART